MLQCARFVFDNESFTLYESPNRLSGNATIKSAESEKSACRGSRELAYTEVAIRPELMGPRNSLGITVRNVTLPRTGLVQLIEDGLERCSTLRLHARH